MPTTPPFDAEYAICPICPSKAATDAVFTIRPRCPWSSTGSVAAMASAASRSTLNVPIRLTVTTRLNSVQVVRPLRDSIRPAVPMPAQFTASRSGAVRSAVGHRAPHVAALVRHRRRGVTPVGGATCPLPPGGQVDSDDLRPDRPSRRRRGARPEAAPVTMAEHPLICMDDDICSHAGRARLAEVPPAGVADRSG